MGYDFRFPNITGATEREQLSQIKTYLYQLVEQLQFAVNDVSNPTTQAALIAQLSQTAQQRPSSSHSATTSFSDLKALIIKSADIVDAYYEEINKRLEGIYVAESDFGTFKEQTSQDIEENSTEVERAFTNIQVLETNLQDTKVGLGSNLESISEEIGKIDSSIQDTRASIDDSVSSLTGEISALETNLQDTKSSVDGDISALQGELNAVKTTVETYANIKSGLLYYDDNGIAVYGVEVGQEDVINGEKKYKRFARFIADKLSFYDQNEQEVAYISNYKLHITHAEVLGTLQVGGYLIDTSNGLTFKWVGRS